MYPYAAYFALNVSSPNTPGLRALQDKKPLTDIVQVVNETMGTEHGWHRKPLFVKIAPELTAGAIDDVIEVVLENGLTGIIAANTTINPDYRRMATEKVAHIYQQTKGKVDIIGVGGVKDAQTALEKIKAGAKVVQVVTGIRGEGTALPGRINRGIVVFMDKEGVRSVQELVGIGVKE